jgi:hypothetical protein
MGVDGHVERTATPPAVRPSWTITRCGPAIAYRFGSGTTSGYGLSTISQQTGAVTGRVAATAVLTGLTPGTRYYFRLDAGNGAASAPGTQLTLTTAAAANR